MNIKGPAVVNLPVGDTPGICCAIDTKKNQTFAKLVNCSYRNFGIKVIAVYFLVDILLRPRFLNRKKENDEQFELVDGDDGCDGDDGDDDDFCKFELGLSLLLFVVWRFIL